VSRVPGFPVYLFDVDGTLLDSAPDICGAIQSVLATTSIDAVPDEFLRGYIGRHLIDLFSKLFPDFSGEEIDRLVGDYRSIYPLRGHQLTKPYPHVVETVSALGGRKSTATTKGTPTTRTVLEMFGLAPHFDHIQGTDGFPAKPAPDVIFKSLAVLGVKPEECLLVGDAGPDMEAGRRAGVKICAVRYGYGDEAEMARFKPDFWIDDIRELL
jgi:phosphoglycolate phosphatase